MSRTNILSMFKPFRPDFVAILLSVREVPVVARVVEGYYYFMVMLRVAFDQAIPANQITQEKQVKPTLYCTNFLNLLNQLLNLRR